MRIFPERFLTRRYALESDLWALHYEISRLELEAEPLRSEIVRLNTQTGFTRAMRREALARELHPLTERIRTLNLKVIEQRRQLVLVEQQLRETFRAVGKSDQVVLHSASGPTSQETQTKTRLPYDFDLFISHASDDNDVATPLAEALRDLGLRVWFDRDILSVGDSLRRSIDLGLSSSRYGVVILSPAFLRKGKGWTTYELDSLVAREIDARKVILPIWHKLTRDEILGYSPSLADKVALNTATATVADIALDIAITVHRDR